MMVIRRTRINAYNQTSLLVAAEQSEFTVVLQSVHAQGRSCCTAKTRSRSFPDRASCLERVRVLEHEQTP